MTTTTVPPGGGHSSPLGLMSCVRESSPQDLVPQTELMDVERNGKSPEIVTFWRTFFNQNLFLSYHVVNNLKNRKICSSHYF